MKKTVATLTLAGALMAGTIGAVVTPASAQDDGSTTESAPSAERSGPRHHRLIKGVVKTSAEVIGIEAKDLVTQLRAGSSIASVAEANGVDPQTVVDALVAKGSERISAALEAGKITEERAAKAMERLPERAAAIVERVPGSGPRAN